MSWSLFVSSSSMMFESFILCLVKFNTDCTFNWMLYCWISWTKLVVHVLLTYLISHFNFLGQECWCRLPVEMIRSYWWRGVWSLYCWYICGWCLFFEAVVRLQNVGVLANSTYGCRTSVPLVTWRNSPCRIWLWDGCFCELYLSVDHWSMLMWEGIWWWGW